MAEQILVEIHNVDNFIGDVRFPTLEIAEEFIERFAAVGIHATIKES